MAEVNWQDPPVRNGSRVGKWVDILTPLMEQPGRWAVVLTCTEKSKASGTSQNIKNGQLKVPPGKWETCSRGYDVYARYIGPE